MFFFFLSEAPCTITFCLKHVVVVFMWKLNYDGKDYLVNQFSDTILCEMHQWPLLSKSNDIMRPNYTGLLGSKIYDPNFMCNSVTCFYYEK